MLEENQAKDTQAPPEPGYNCNTSTCPLVSNNCTLDHVIYRVTVMDQNQNKKTYTGLTRSTFKNVTMVTHTVFTTEKKIQQHFHLNCGNKKRKTKILT